MPHWFRLSVLWYFFFPFHCWYTSRCRNGICSISFVSFLIFIDLKLFAAVICHWGKIVLDWHILIYCLFESQDEKALIDWTDSRKWRWMPIIISRQSLTPLSKSNNTFRNVWRTLQENRTVILLLGPRVVVLSSSDISWDHHNRIGHPV